MAVGERKVAMRSSVWAGIAVLALVLAPGVLALARVWATLPYYSHGFLVPIFSLAAGHANRDRLGPLQSDVRGRWLLLAALGVYAFGIGAGSVSLQGLAVVGVVAAGVLWAWGPSGLRVLAFPVVFLLFAVPLPTAVVSPTIVALQVQVSSTAVWLLHELGVPLLRDGNVLVLPNGESLFVAEACSGITSLLTLTPLAVALAWFTLRRWGTRSLLVASVVPLAMAANLLRVLATVLAAERWGAELVTASVLHEMGGLATFGLACVGLLGVGSLLGAREARGDAAAAA